MSGADTDDTEVIEHPDRPWRAMLRVLFVVHLVTASAFSLVVPFLPLFVKQLGSRGGAVVFWSGVVFAAPALTMMVASPFWGIMADRYGRKMMLVRATAAGAIVLALMGFARTSMELALLRALQGALTGYLAASNALVAATVPRRVTGGSLGMLRTANWIGLGVGPLVGGVVGDLLGFRACFWLTAGMLGLSSLVVALAIPEKTIPSRQSRRGFFETYRELIRTPGLRRVYSVSFLDSLARSAVTPVIPLIMVSLSGGLRFGVATLTGLLLGVKAFAGSVASIFVGRLGDRIGHGRVVFSGALALAVFYAPQPFVNEEWQFVLLQGLVGVAAVGLVPGVAALLAHFAPPDTTGAVYGLESSLDALGRSIGPMVGVALVVTLKKRSVLAAAALVYALLSLVIGPLRTLVARPEGAR